MPLLVPRLTRIHGVATLLVLAGVVAQAQDQQPPRFRSGVEVVTVDVTVVDGDGRPVRGLRPADFVVDVDGQRRRVVSAQWIQLTPEGPLASPGANVSAISVPPAAPYSSNDRPTGGRLIVMFVDRFNIRFEGMIALRSAIAGFLNRLQPSDRVALVVDGYGTSMNIPFTTDRERVRAAVGQIGAQRGLAPGGAGPDWRLAIRELLTGLKSIEAPKTVLFISEGFPTGSADEPLLADTRPFLVELEHLAAESRTIIYGLRLDSRVSDLRWQTQDMRLGPDLTAPPASSRAGAARRQGAPDLGDQRAMPGPANAPTPDRGDGGGLYSVAAVTGGSMFTIVMKADSAFARIDSELSGYYLLGIEADPTQRDGKPHAITVGVARSGATVRSRRTLIVSAPPVRARTPEEVLLPAFSSPTPMAGLPIRVSSVARRGPGKKDVQLMIHAEVGADYTEQTPVVLGFVIADANDKIIQRRAGNSTIQPSIRGEPSALQVTTSVNLPPGDYTMKLAVADGDRVGSVEHPVHARLGRLGTVIVSDLVVGGVTTAKPIMPPPIGATITTDYVQGILEAYGSNATAITGRLDVAVAIDGPALTTAAIATVPAGDDRAVLGQVLSIRDLRPGRYVLRAVLALPNIPPQTIIRTFERR
jgi:VWFA-related protein